MGLLLRQEYIRFMLLPDRITGLKMLTATFCSLLYITLNNSWSGSFTSFMKTNLSVRIKAVFLLAVFALNTVVGLACPTMADRRFHSSGHNKKAKKSVYLHKEVKKNIHTANTHKQLCHNKATFSNKDDCCKDKVARLPRTDKNIRYSKITITPPVFVITNRFAQIPVFTIVVPDMQEYIACHFHPPPRDAGIAIQCFRIWFETRV